MAKTPIPKGDEAREAIDALRGYVYQIYQSALALIELGPEEFLFLEVAEDYAIVAADALNAVQVKETEHNVTINSGDIVATIDSFVYLRQKNPDLQVRMRHLTTSKIGKEKSPEHRIGETPTLEIWRKLSKTGDLVPLRKILNASKLSEETKKYIRKLDHKEFREAFLKRIHFDCGAPDSKFLLRLLRSKLLKLVMERGGVNSQVDGCLSSIVIALLQKTTQKEGRFVDRNMLEEFLERATQIPVNRAQLQAQNELISKALTASVQQGANLTATRLAVPTPINEVPLPAAIANRTIQIDNIVSSLSQYGISWIFGASGVGKTIGAKIAARHLGGNWAGINLRNLNADQVHAVLTEAVDTLTEQEIDGLLVDDLECQIEPHILDILLYFRAICDRADLPLIFVSPRQPSPDFLFSAQLPKSIEQRLGEFTEQDLEEILVALGVHNANWLKYIYFVSGGGHPQLAIAAIQSMENSGWDINELRTLNSLLDGDTAVEQVRARTRERLLSEIPEGGRRLLERLSLKFGSFRRRFVLDMAQVAPAIPDGGIVFDRLIGSWVDQQERDRFALSPLLSNLALNTLTDEQKREIYFEIANSLTKGRSIDPIDANSALSAAWFGKNIPVIFRLCSAVFAASQNNLRTIAPYLIIFSLFKTDVFPYVDDPVVSQMLRGAQLLLVCQEKTSGTELKKLLNRFEEESNCVETEAIGTSIAYLVYARLLLTESNFGALPNFWDLISKLDELLERKDKRPLSELIEEPALREIDGIPAVGFMFLNQARQIKLINELLPTFEFLNSCGQKLRQKLFKLFNDPDFQVDFLVSGAWLSEYNANTIDPTSHSGVFARLEELAISWGYIDLAVCCRKFRAIITDESGGDKDKALLILDEGMELYGETNSELVRAKAKVLYRAENHQESLELSKILIEEEAPLSKTEKVFLGRDAAISAEKQGDYDTARRYFLYASRAAGKCDILDMVPMRIGLMADAALASWHAGDRECCLREFIAVLQDLNDIVPKSSLRAAHCHALCRHVLLWLNQDATGKKLFLANGGELKIYPGIVSNPEPHPEIKERYIIPIEMAWYMLATLENNCCLDLGITQNLQRFLPKGLVVEGNFMLTPSKMTKAFTLLDIELFVAALRETVAEVAYVKEKGDYRQNFDPKKLTYGSLPAPALEAKDDICAVTEQFVLSFASHCICLKSIAELNQLICALESAKELIFRNQFLKSLRGNGSTEDYNISFAGLLVIHKRAIDDNETLSPALIFELAFKALQVAVQTNTIEIVAKSACEWLNDKITFILEHQRFLLRSPTLYEEGINLVHMEESNSWTEKFIDLLKAILPTMAFQNETELDRILNNIRKAKG